MFLDRESVFADFSYLSLQRPRTSFSHLSDTSFALPFHPSSAPSSCCSNLERLWSRMETFWIPFQMAPVPCMFGLSSSSTLQMRILVDHSPRLPSALTRFSLKPSPSICLSLRRKGSLFSAVSSRSRILPSTRRADPTLCIPQSSAKSPFRYPPTNDGSALYSIRSSPMLSSSPTSVKSSFGSGWRARRGWS